MLLKWAYPQEIKMSMLKTVDGKHTIIDRITLPQLAKEIPWALRVGKYPIIITLNKNS